MTQMFWRSGTWSSCSTTERRTSLSDSYPSKLGCGGVLVWWCSGVVVCDGVGCMVWSGGVVVKCGADIDGQRCGRCLSVALESVSVTIPTSFVTITYDHYKVSVGL